MLLAPSEKPPYLPRSTERDVSEGLVPGTEAGEIDNPPELVDPDFVLQAVEQRQVQVQVQVCSGSGSGLLSSSLD